MYRIEIPTTALNMRAENDDLPDGGYLADLLRLLADEIEETIQITPCEGEDEWTPEVRKFTARVDGVLFDVTHTLEANS